MFAIIKTGGKQLKVSENSEIFIEKVDLKENQKISFDQVLMIDDTIGTPFIKNAEVKGTVLKQGKSKKIVVFKYKPKKNYHKKYGHKQPYTKVKIDKIVLNKNNVEKESKASNTKKASASKKTTVKK